MILENPFCPTCGEGAVGTVDTIPYCVAQFNRTAGDTDSVEEDEDPNDVEYGGETEVNWDGQETNLNEAGESQVACSNGHTWFTKIT